MYQIIDKRGSGKTSRLMRIAKQTNALFVCRNVELMTQKAKDYGIIGIDFISYKNFIQTPPTRKYVIDELEEFIKFAFHEQQLIGYTLSK